MKTRSKVIGRNILKAEVTNISQHGLWILVGVKEYFLPFQEYPWFKDVKVSSILDVHFLHGQHLHWPQLDVDLDIESLEHPESYPLSFKA